MRVYFETLGCPKNACDTEMAEALIEAAGHTVAEEPETADAILVNTCAFIDDAKRESIARILDMSAYRAAGKKLIVSGCLAQRYSQELLEEMPEVDAFLGVNDYEKLPALLDSLAEAAASGTGATREPSEGADAARVSAPSEGAGVAHVSVPSEMDGTASGPSGATDVTCVPAAAVSDINETTDAARELSKGADAARVSAPSDISGTMDKAQVFASSEVRKAACEPSGAATDRAENPAYRAGIVRPALVSGVPGAVLARMPRRHADRPYSASLRIAEGCNNRCAYCVIPSIRGPFRSKRREDVLAEAVELAAAGCRELNLIAQDVTNYGIDLYGTRCLPDLLTDLCRIEGIEWIRLMYCYEDRVSDELIEVMAGEPKICHYIDLPIQHCNDRILHAMGRRSTKASILSTIGRLRKAIPDIHIRTTLIAGFPGETEAEFTELMDFVSAVRFERLGVFAYSQEENTPAGRMAGQLPEAEKAARADALMARQMDISLSQNRAKIGRTLPVLVEGRDEDGSYTGRTAYDAPEIDDGVLFTSARALGPGDMVRVTITDAFDYDLCGREALL